MAERPQPYITDILAAIAEAIGAVSVSSRLAAQNSKQAKEAAEKIGKSRQKAAQSNFGPFDVLSGPVTGDDNAKQITRMLRGEGQSSYEEATATPSSAGEAGQPIPRKKRRKRPSQQTANEQALPRPSAPINDAVGYMDPETGEWESTQPLELAQSGAEQRGPGRSPRFDWSFDPDKQKENRRKKRAFRSRNQDVLRNRIKKIVSRQNPTTGESSAENARRSQAEKFAKEDAEREELVRIQKSGKNPFAKGNFFQEFDKGWASVRRTAGKATSGGGSGLGGAISRIFGGMGGGGAGAGGAGSATTGAGGAAGLGATAATAAPVVGAVIGIGVAAVATTKALHDMAKETLENSREMARYSGTIQNSIALYDRQNRILQAKTAQETAGSVKGLSESTARFNQEIQPLLTDVAIIKNMLLSRFMTDMAGLIGMIKFIRPELKNIHQVLQWIANKDKDTTPALQNALRTIAHDKSVLSDKQRGAIRVPKPTPDAKRMHTR